MTRLKFGLVPALMITLLLPLTGCLALVEDAIAPGPKGPAPREAAPEAAAPGSGPNTVSGSSSFIVKQSQRGPDLVCRCDNDRAKVYLIPASPEADEVMAGLFGRDRMGLVPFDRKSRAKGLPALLSRARLGQCDPKGNFTFDQVPDGSFYLWVETRGRGEAAGGIFMKKIEVSGGAQASASIIGDLAVPRPVD